MNFAMWQMISCGTTGLGLAGTGAYLSPWVWRQFHMRRIHKHLSNSGILALTYDDGPSEAVTPALLDLLHHRGVHATFFMLGRHAKRYPRIADRVAREGHGVGCHSYQHVNAWKAMPRAALADIEAGYDQLSSWIPRNGMFRPPHGKMTLPTYWAIHRRRAPVWWWTIDSGDTNRMIPSTGKVVEVLNREKGGIVLMHDLDRGRERNEFVLELTDALLDVAKRKSLRVIALTEISK